MFVLLDKGDNNQFNFEELFMFNVKELENEVEELSKKARKKTKIEAIEKQIKIIKRTQKIFYVCCTRAKKNLVVYYHNPTDAVLERAREWFGKDSCGYSNVQEI